MKYYLVGILDSESYSQIEEIQKKISAKYDLYQDLPILHMTLEVIDNPQIDKLISALDEIISGKSPFIIEVNGAICFEPPFKSVNLLINKDLKVMEFIKHINNQLKLRGFSVRDDINAWDLHISLANNNFSTRKWSQAEYVSACTLVQSLNFKKSLIIESIELWKPINDKNEMVLKSFSLN
ncbi:2'-5' RNA ligase family protein [Oceanirhabdus sp. W0125-5]|uniref:2'-5' RNA ligase family protein n=1 Tax=Oceanirhabdus sp. W0125-5 TaxID=2999116 RepID=UPI0022F2A8FB|nr:2'-5' RNA ligase family protein [Oceanirhabdus sp. W0125-5]WBW97705.1 2'-5' RNA ligase family protein [Oceanirhabdus sp. W0125-5]